MRRRLYLRLYFAFLGVLLAIGVVAAGIHVITGRIFFSWIHAGPRMANHIARSLPQVDDREALARAVDQLHDELGVDVTIIEPDGTPLASAGAPIPLPDPLSLARARHTAGWLPGHGIVGGPVRSGRAVVLARLPVPGERNLHWRGLLLLAGALLVSLALVYPLSRSITRPVEQLTAAVEAYGRGDVTKRSGLDDSEDEVGRLARTFDEMADRIQATRRAEKELLANVSHELRTPLARIRVAMELIDARDDSVRRRIAVVSGEVDELERLVSDVLTASKLDLAAQPLRKVPVRVEVLVEKSRQRALALSQAVDTDVDAGLELNADEPLLARALDNLLDNARKYAGTQPVRVEAHRAGGQVTLAVRDHGPGIPPEELAFVFDPFFRGTSVRGQASGFGLGLALARRVAEVHGGTIRAVNAEGGGARIELSLPA